MKVLVKLGGTLLDDAKTCHAVARQLVDVARRFHLVVVHGGGKQMTRYLQEHGVSSRFINGLRVSDEVVIDAALKVIAGSVNKQLVSAIIRAGEKALGISGADGLLTSAVPIGPELCFAGRPGKTDGRLLDLLISSGFLPVVACLAGDEQGNLYNVNADQMAVSCALGWRADRLIFLTDVEGVKGQDGCLFSHLSPHRIQKLIESGVATAGMRAKLDAAILALGGGLDEAVIASGHEPDICRRLLAGEQIGTRLSSQPVPAAGSLP